MPIGEGRILIAAPDADRRGRLRAALAGLTLDLDEAGSLERALDQVREQRPDLVLAAVLLDEDLAPLLAATPTIVFGPVREACIEALDGGAIDFLVEPFDDRELCCRAVLRLREARERHRTADRERELLAEAHMAAEAFESRERAEAALRKSEERFRLASEAISGLVYDWDVVEDRVRRSQGLRGLLGHCPEDVDHVVGWWTNQIHPEDWEAASSSVYAAIDGGEPLFSAEYRMRHQDGHWVHVWDRGLILRDETGRPVRVVGSTVDISDRKRVEEELKAANEAKDRFLATLSHELRTPLTPVLALVSSLERDGRVPDWLRGQLNLMRRNVELESRLIDDLLDLTRVTSGKLELRREAVDLGDVLAHALRASGPAIAAKGLRLVETGLHPGSLLAWADAPRLTQVFWNLLNNAAKFTPAPGTITVRSRSTGREILIEVQDTGMGIEADVLPRIFGAFEQAGRGITRRYGGLGLGLAVSRAIVRLHGGDLTASSPGAGGGATFTIRLPAGVPEGNLDETLPGFARPSVSLPRNLRLLLVEDHLDTAAAMADLLRDLGHEVTVASSVATAREAVERDLTEREGGFDLLISDLGLPDGSGLELMGELADRHGLRGIALSGYGMDEDIRRSREAGFVAHLTKPVSLQTLQDAILQAACR